MLQKIINGFPQYYDLTYQRSYYVGTLATQIQKQKTDINLLTDCIGDQIHIDEDSLNLLSIVRDGASLIPGQGFELIAENTIRVSPGLLNGETLELKKLTGSNAILESIPTVPPIVTSDGFDQTTIEAIIWTDGSESNHNANPAIVVDGKTRVSTLFSLDAGKVDIFINGKRYGKYAGVWSFVDSNTVELDNDYSTTKMYVEIVKQVVGV